MMKTNNIWRFATIFFLSLMVPLLCQSCSGQAENKRTADSLFADSLRPKTKLKPLVQPKKPPMVSTSDENSDGVFSDYETMPQFPGGNAAFGKFLKENTHCPEEVIRDSIQGRIVASFIIEKDGYITELKIVKNSLKNMDGGPIPYDSEVLKQCEKEALRVLKLMPRWQPGTQNGIPVRVKYNVPVWFNRPKPKSRWDR